MIQGLVPEALCTAGLVIAACRRDYYSQNTLGVNPAGYIKLVIMLKWFWGLIGGWEGIFLLPLFWWSKLQLADFFPSPLGNIIYWSIFFFLSPKTDMWINKLEYSQQEQSVKGEIETMTRFYNIYSNGASSLKSIGSSFKNERWKFFPNTWVLDSGGRKKWSRRGIIIQTNITIVW